MSVAEPAVAAPPQHVAVIGAGPAGLAAAETLATHGVRVTVFERMPSPARKFLMAGRGGLNLTHAEPLPQFLSRYSPTADRVAPWIEAHPPAAVVAWAEGLGQETFVGSSGRVFPKSMKASPLLRTWLQRLAGLGVDIKTRHAWQGWDSAGAPLVSTDGGPPAAVACDALVLALGGASWPRLGSDGKWTAILEEAGVPVTPLTASNAGLTIGWSRPFRDRFAGEPLKRIAVTCAGKTARGEAVVTLRGLEGGAVYALSSRIAAATRGGLPVTLHLDLKPDEPLAVLVARLRRPRGKDSVSTWLRKSLKLAPVAVGLLREASRNLPPAPDDLARLVKHLPLAATGTAGLERAISTAGGVAFAGVGSDLMLKARPGTFIAGEMLDWDAPTGGYLLQACLASGVAAARGALAYLKAPR